MVSIILVLLGLNSSFAQSSSQTYTLKLTCDCVVYSEEATSVGIDGIKQSFISDVPQPVVNTTAYGENILAIHEIKGIDSDASERQVESCEFGYDMDLFESCSSPAANAIEMCIQKAVDEQPDDYNHGYKYWKDMTEIANCKVEATKN